MPTSHHRPTIRRFQGASYLQNHGMVGRFHRESFLLQQVSSQFRFDQISPSSSRLVAGAAQERLAPRKQCSRAIQQSGAGVSSSSFYVTAFSAPRLASEKLVRSDHSQRDVGVEPRRLQSGHRIPCVAGAGDKSFNKIDDGRFGGHGIHFGRITIFRDLRYCQNV